MALNGCQQLDSHRSFSASWNLFDRTCFESPELTLLHQFGKRQSSRMRAFSRKTQLAWAATRERESLGFSSGTKFALASNISRHAHATRQSKKYLARLRTKHKPKAVTSPPAGSTTGRFGLHAGLQGLRGIVPHGHPTVLELWILHSGTRALGHSGTRALGHSGTRALGHSGTRALGHSGTRALGHSGTRALGHSGQTAGSPESGASSNGSARQRTHLRVKHMNIHSTSPRSLYTRNETVKYLE